MRNLRVGLSLIGISIYALLLLNNLPGPWANEMRFADSTFSYVVMGLFFYLAVYFLGLQSLEYFRLPRIHFKTLLALLIASPIVISAVTHNENTHLKPWVAVRGIFFLLAYWHVMNTFSFGVFTYALMIATRSIWSAVIFHALCDWGIVFDKAFIDTGDEGKWQPGLWEGLSAPLFNVILFCGLALVLLWIDRGRVPAWMYRWALKWKLVKPEFELTA